MLAYQRGHILRQGNHVSVTRAECGVWSRRAAITWMKQQVPDLLKLKGLFVSHSLKWQIVSWRPDISPVRSNNVDL